MIDNRLVGRRISSLRQGRALTQQQLAAMMNVSHQAVSKWESGQALPDIQTMLELTRFFGITVEQLTSAQEEAAQPIEPEYAYENPPASDTSEDEPAANDGGKRSEEKKEVKHMSMQQLLQMAPFMSRETVEEIVMEIEGGVTAAQIAKIAPYVGHECVEKLIEKHKPELSWDTLRRIAPFMSREAVDELARAIASGRESVKPANDSINKTINDIGKAFDDIGKGVGHAMKKAIRFGERMINEASSAISDLSSEAEVEVAAHVRSERAVALRRRAFERALADGRWDWLSLHISELDGDAELRAKIAACAREEGMNEWICTHMGGYVDENSIDAAIAEGRWDYLGENIFRLDNAMQEKAALAAMEAENWDWLGCFCDQLTLKDCGGRIASAALQKGENALAAQIAAVHLAPDALEALAREVCAADNCEALAMIAHLLSDEAVANVSAAMAAEGKWAGMEPLLQGACPDTVEKLMEIAVEQGDFEAIDLLDRYL